MVSRIHESIKQEYNMTKCDILNRQESAVDFGEIEEALMLVKSKKEQENTELDFLTRVDEENGRGNSLFLNSFIFVTYDTFVKHLKYYVT